MANEPGSAHDGVVTEISVYRTGCAPALAGFWGNYLPAIQLLIEKVPADEFWVGCVAAMNSCALWCGARSRADHGRYRRVSEYPSARRVLPWM